MQVKPGIVGYFKTGLFLLRKNKIISHNDFDNNFKKYRKCNANIMFKPHNCTKMVCNVQGKHIMGIKQVYLQLRTNPPSPLKGNTT